MELEKSLFRVHERILNAATVKSFLRGCQIVSFILGNSLGNGIVCEEPSAGDHPDLHLREPNLHEQVRLLGQGLSRIQYNFKYYFPSASPIPDRLKRLYAGLPSG